MAEVPNRAKDPKRAPVNFYNAQGEYSHTADVRWNGARGYTSSRPHAGDIKKNMPSMGAWSVPELDNNPNAPESSYFGSSSKNPGQDLRDRLKYHVSGAVERGEKTPIVEQTTPKSKGKK